MANVQLVTMRAQALREADAEGHLDMTVTADKDRVTDYVNAGLERLWDILTSAFEDYHLTLSGSVTIAGGADSAALASDVLKVRFVEYWPSGVVGTGAPVDVEPMNIGERIRHTGIRSYYITAFTTLNVRPSADAPGVYRVLYTPQFVALQNDADAFQSVNGWHRWAVLDAAIKLRQDMDRDASLLVQRQGDMEKHIRSLASRRISGRPSKVRRVRKSMADWARDWADPSRWT